MIGYKLDKDYTKKGYMTEALNLMQISLEDTIKTIQNSRKELK